MADAKLSLTEVQSSWEEHRGRLTSVAALRIPSMLLSRVSAEDVVQQTFLNALKRPEFFREHPEVPVFAKLRMILMQTIHDLERQHLACQKRDAYREVSFDDSGSEDGTQIQERWNLLAATVTSPRTKLDREENRALIRTVLKELNPADREILEMRHFEQLSNAECAGVLGVSPDAASIRYVRALKKMRQLLLNLTEFHP